MSCLAKVWKESWLWQIWRKYKFTLIHYVTVVIGIIIIIVIIVVAVNVVITQIY